MMTAPQFVIIAGPNGAGKSTSAPALLPEGVPYINADEIAKKLSNLDPGVPNDIEASRRLLQEWDRLADVRANFAVETTLASRSLAPRIRRLQEIGFRFLLYYFWLPSPELAIARVAARVRLGGHNIPEDVIRRRYEAGWRNFFEIYQPLADRWEVYANLANNQSIMVAEGKQTRPTVINEPMLWQVISERRNMNENIIREATAEYEPIWRIHERAVQKAVRAAVQEHKRAGNPIAIWKNEQVIWIPASEIDIEEAE
jgi:predicted ABC-type ATPase